MQFMYLPYAYRMEWDLRELRFFVVAVEAGSFTDAAIELRVSQAAVSLRIAALEKRVGERVLRRTRRGCEPTAVGRDLLSPARRLLLEADRFADYVHSRRGVLRLGYAWAALGRHTTSLQRTWAAAQPDYELQLVRHNSVTAGLHEGMCDVAVMRREANDRRFDSVVVGQERRLVAFASDDQLWARRRQVTMAEIADRTVVIDARTGTTSTGLWEDAAHQPQVTESSDVDEWLDIIAAGQAVGTTAEATAHHHARPGVTFRPIKDGPRIPVRLAWWRDDPPGGLSDLISAVTQCYEIA